MGWDLLSTFVGLQLLPCYATVSMTHFVCLICYFVKEFYMALPAILAAIAGAALPVIGDVMNMKNVDRTNDMNATLQREVNAQNKDMFNQQMDYARATQQETWNREDTAYQRAAQDAKAAGFSPLVASGVTAGGAGQVVSQPSAPQMSAARMQAPQFSDLNGLSMLYDMEIKQRELGIEDRKLNIEESRIDKEIGERKASRLQDEQQFTRSLDNIQAQLNQRLAQEKDLADRRILQSITEFNDSLKLRERAQTHAEEVKAQEITIAKVNQMMERARGATGGRSSNFRAYDDYAEYTVAKRQWDNDYMNMITMYLTEPTSSSQSQSRGGSGNVSVAGTGLGLGANVAGSSSRSVALKQEAQINRFFATHPYPVFYGRMNRSK